MGNNSGSCSFGSAFSSNPINIFFFTVNKTRKAPVFLPAIPPVPVSPRAKLMNKWNIVARRTMTKRQRKRMRPDRQLTVANDVHSAAGVDRDATYQSCFLNGYETRLHKKPAPHVMCMVRMANNKPGARNGLRL